MRGRRKIGVLTSGGDAPGMNAAIRAVVRVGVESGLEIFGVRRGFNGLLTSDIICMNLRSVSDIIDLGGTILYTARSKEFATKEGIALARDNCKKLGLDGLIIIGGDGSLRGARELSEAGVFCVGIPGTIDNDVNCSEYAIGFDTAMNTAMRMIDKIRDTAKSHERCSIVEVMGRNCGEIALQTGISVGATAIIVPEVFYDFKKDIINRIKVTQKKGKKYFIVIVSEGIGKINDIAEQIYMETGIETRTTVLGHVQRGGSPTLRDRVVASKMGAKAIEIICKGTLPRIIAMKSEKIIDCDINQDCIKKEFDLDLYNTALKISI
ncbi:6-phosphofructokinase [Clostridium sp. CAG:557]|jgi:6-phosphofructokinase 1|nr:6-phosphofructokinase [Clostridium sp. CAG:557]